MKCLGYNAIVVCPTGQLSNQGGFMDNPDNAIILATIDSTIDVYNIDTTLVYLAGFSCNGYTTLKYGTNAIYPWKGLIPIHPALPAVVFSPGATAAGLFDFNTTVPTCFCSGSLDQGLAAGQQFRDSLVLYGAPHLYNLIPNVGHTTQFATFKQEMMECFNFFNPTPLAVGVLNTINETVNVYPNPSTGAINVEVEGEESKTFLIYDARGTLVDQHTLNATKTTLPLEELSAGIYFWTLSEGSKLISKGKLLLQ